MTIKLARIEGTLTFTDGTSHEFSIGTDGVCQQWGGVTEQLGKGVDALETMTAALNDDDLLASADDDDDDDDDDEEE